MVPPKQKVTRLFPQLPNTAEFWLGSKPSECVVLAAISSLLGMWLITWCRLVHAQIGVSGVCLMSSERRDPRQFSWSLLDCTGNGWHRKCLKVFMNEISLPSLRVTSFTDIVSGEWDERLSMIAIMEQHSNKNLPGNYEKMLYSVVSQDTTDCNP